MPRFSLVIPAYNVGSYLGGCLQSLEDQTFSDFEAIVVDDASTDATNSIAASFAQDDSRFSVIRHEHNQGRHLTRKTGVAVAIGDYIVPLDGDDSLELDTLEKLDQALKDEPVDSIHYGLNAIAAGATSAAAAQAFEAFNNFGEGTLSQEDLVRTVFCIDGGFRRDWRITNHAYRRDMCQKAFDAMTDQRLERAEDAYEYLVLCSFLNEEATRNDILGYNYYLGRGIINYDPLAPNKYLKEVEYSRKCWEAALAWADVESNPLIEEAAQGLKYKVIEIVSNDWATRIDDAHKASTAYSAAQIMGANEMASNLMRLARDRAYTLWVEGESFQDDPTPVIWANLGREIHGVKKDDELWFDRYLAANTAYFNHANDINRRALVEAQRRFIDTAAAQPNRILVSAHREFAHFDADSLQMIQVGAALASTHFQNMLHDDEGDNDSKLNRMLCEMTAQYWAWKHVDADYIGFCHYRRYFNFSDKHYKENPYGEIMDGRIDEVAQAKYGLDDASIAKAIEGYDIISAPIQDIRKMPGAATTPLEQYADAPKLHVEDLILCGEVAKTLYPDYAEDVDSYLNGHFSCFCNMYIMRGQLFKDYAAWVFPILDETMKHLDMDRYSVEGVRTPGHLAERLFNIYLAHLKRTQSSLAIKELQVVHFEDPAPRATEKPLPSSITKPIVPVAFAADDNYVPMLTTTITSMLENASKDRHYDIVVLTNNISGDNRALISSLVDSYGDASVRFVDATPFIAKFKLTTNNPHISNETYYRFLIQELLPFYNKVLYLDSDLIVTGDVAELFDTDVNDYLLAATRDIDFLGNINMPDGKRMAYAKKVLGLKDPYDYFQAGVLLLNTNAMRQKLTMEQWLQKATNDEYIYNDQDVLNAECQGQVLYLDQSWNVMIDCDYRIERVFSFAPAKIYNDFMRARQEARITHYAGFQKPWNMVRCDRAPLYWHYARLTPFYEELTALLAKNLPPAKMHMPVADRPPKVMAEDNPIRKVIDPLMPYGTRRRELFKSLGRTLRGLNNNSEA